MVGRGVDLRCEAVVVRPECAVDPSPCPFPPDPASRGLGVERWRQQQVVDVLAGSAVAERSRPASVVELRVGADVPQVGARQQRRKWRGVRSVVEVTQDRDVADACRAEPAIDVGDALGLATPLVVVRRLRAVALGLQMVDEDDKTVTA